MARWPPRQQLERMSVSVRRAGGRQHLRARIYINNAKVDLLAFYYLYSQGVHNRHAPIERTVSSFRCSTPVLLNIRTRKCYQYFIN